MWRHRVVLHVWPTVCDVQVAEERLSNMRTVRAFVGENREIGVYNSRIDKVLHLSYKESIARGIFWAMASTVYKAIRVAK
jgi:ATP-binding cassette, subfamily B (MDR/TAP), member 10